MPVISQGVILSMLGSVFSHWVILPAVGASGGILLAWRQDLGPATASRVDEHSISVQFSPAGLQPWWLTCVYGPQGDERKILFLQELRNVRSACQGPWSVLGDFNLITNAEDKNNGILNRAMMGRFRRLINELELKELPLQGRKFTWSNQQESPTLVKLDRVFCSSEWENLFPNCLLQSGASDGSDHCPLLLGLHDVQPRKARFHFESFWCKLEGFQDAVETAWTSVDASCCPFDTLARKFRATVRRLQSWSQKKVGHVNTQLGLAREILHQLEIAQDHRALSGLELWLRNKLKLHSLALSSLQRTIARCRSRISWLCEGDANTAMFHSHARHRMRKNFIYKLTTDDGLVLTKHEEKEQNIFNFYSTLLGENLDRGVTVNLEALNAPNLDLSELDDPFSEEEVWKTISSLPPDKAPGPDGFTGKFYKVCWPIIKQDIMAAASAVWSRNFNNFELLNSAFITLLPKKDDVTSIRDYRPISLVHSFAKLITKLLANRLAGRLDRLITPNQSAFIKGRFILDNFMLVQHTTKYLHQQKQARILLKLDITKAFDSVSWPFILEVLQHVGFGSVWCDIISGLLASSSTQILLNGSPGERIKHRRGLRHGDLLSPMLFILAMDVLCLLFQKAAEEELLQPLARRNIQHRISLYADDVVIFLRPSVSDIRITLDLLQLFGEASGLRTNIQKSNVLPIQCSEEDRAVLLAHLPCQISEFPCKYLGVPLSPHKLTRAQVHPIIDKIADRLPGWKADLLTKAGRKILVQFVLTSMLIYLAMALDLPSWALKAVDKIRRGFLWKGRKDVRGGHCLVAWPKVTRPLELGGLGISQLQQLGWALRMRWLWLLKTEPDKPWNFFPIQVHHSVRTFFSAAISSEVGNGKNTLFWTDKWLHGQSLEMLAPLLFNSVSSRAKKRTVYDALTDGRWVADIRGARTVGVLTEFLDLWDLLAEVVLQPEVDDSHIWRFSSTGKYSAKSAYEAMFIGATHFKPWERIWRSWAPGKCRFFMWLVAHNKCWTADRLARKGLPHPEQCPLCDQEEETINHLLVSCVFSRQVWFIVFQQFGLQCLAPQPGDLLFDEWWEQVNTRVTDLVKQGLNSLVILVAWAIWNHRNRCVFDGQQPELYGLLRSIRVDLYMWDMAGARGISQLLALQPPS